MGFLSGGSMITQAPKGTKDVLPQDSYRWHWVEQKLRDAAEAAGYREIRTPVFEHTELFLRGVGDTTDIVQKEMYTFNDKGGRSITLKPEGTAGVVRAFVEGKLYAQPLPCKVYYLNTPVFRYENPQSGRLREHHQFGMECFGAKAPAADAELIVTLFHALEHIGINGLSVHINSIGCPACRPGYHQALRDFLAGALNSLCPVCQGRFDKNPLRILDCKEDKCKQVVRGAPRMIDMLCGECADHFVSLQALLQESGVSYKLDPGIVRGLDYYTKTVFEIIMPGVREGLALCGGGRYDGLISQVGGPETPGVGFGIGTERILMELDNRGIVIPEPLGCAVYVANIGEDSLVAAFGLTQALRARGINAECDLAGRSLKAQFRFADKAGAKLILIVGGDELARGVVKARDMTTGTETDVPLDEAPSYIVSALHQEE
jgi:histidyl-tRNA synthetase